MLRLTYLKVSTPVIPAQAGIQNYLKILDSGSVIPDVIRDRNDK